MTEIAQIPKEVGIGLLTKTGSKIAAEAEDAPPTVNFEYQYAGKDAFVFPANRKPGPAFWKRNLAQLKTLMCDFLLKWSFHYQAQAMKNGFKGVLPLEWCRLFDH